MDEKEKMESHLSSAAAFVEGGIQDACEDACSICLEAFYDTDPSTVTGCKHEFHLQCILEWCQRSSQCPMCWQPISLKDPTSQELLEAVERERSLRINQSRTTNIFHHPAIGDFELQHLQVGTSDAELEERIIRHLTAAAMGRARHASRREGGHRRSGAHGRPQFLVLSAHSDAPSLGPVSDLDHREDNNASSASGPADPAFHVATATEEVAQESPHVSSSEVQVSLQPDASSVGRPVQTNDRSPAAAQSMLNSQDRGEPSDFQAFSESLKSRFSAVSMKCKESITKSTRGWKERFFSRNSSVADLGSEVRREVQAGIASVSRLIERLDTRETIRTGEPSEQSEGGHSGTEQTNTRIVLGRAEDTGSVASSSAACTSSGPN